MKKFILAFILSLLFVSFAAFLYNAYTLQKSYFNQKPTEITKDQKEEVKVPEIPSKYINYTKEDYDKALSENRIVLLFFTSNWCTACINQDSINKSVFDDLNKEGILGLSIHILDSQTTSESNALAKKFDVTKENTFVILDKKGAVSFKYVGEMTSEILKLKLNETIAPKSASSSGEVINQ